MYHGALWRGIDDDPQWTGWRVDVEQLVFPTSTRTGHAADRRAEAVIRPPRRRGIAATALGRERGHDGPGVVLIADHLLDICVVEVISEVSSPWTRRDQILD